jgi:hypothetical protein
VEKKKIRSIIGEVGSCALVRRSRASYKRFIMEVAGDVFPGGTTMRGTRE